MMSLRKKKKSSTTKPSSSENKTLKIILASLKNIVQNSIYFVVYKIQHRIHHVIIFY
ncbi:unnamed protein product [Schistosoma curassoni]|uniref:Uncharacterized protein n=1 Tax=Schistosoma curassoni TaxID=6186 RepID=A0A183JUB8_9TREM|nr:unnamed protein product [Schistosoma curassoni]